MRHEVVGQSDVEALAESWQLLDPNAPAAGHGEPRIRSVAELASIRTYASQPIEFAVDQLIALGTVTAITGESGGGKSTFISAICGSIDRGAPFAGLATKRLPILVLDRENPASVVLERFERLGIQDGENYKVWGGWAPEEAPAPFSPMVVDWVSTCNPKPLIVIDSFISFHPGDENDAAETRQFMQGFRKLADMGATVIFTHHTGKSETSKDYRGSSDIKASVDVGYNLSNLKSRPACITSVSRFARRSFGANSTS